MKKEKRTIITILAKEDIVSYLVGVPLAVYIVVFCGNFQGEQFQSLIIGVGIAAILVSPLRFIINYRRMKRLIDLLDDPASGNAALSGIKEKFFREPVKHAWSIALTWFFAISIAFLVVYFLSGTAIFHFYVWLLILSVTMPSGFVITYFITEKGLIYILTETRLSGAVSIKRKQFSITKKVLLSLSTLAWYPTAVLSFILFEIQYKIIVLDYTALHIAFIMIMITGIMFSIAYLLISSLRLTLKSSVESLGELSKGNLVTHIPEISSDEIGEIASDINILSQNLRKMVKVSIKMVDTMNQDSQKLLGFMEEISEGGMGVASSMEEMSSSLEELGASSDAIAENSIKHREFVQRVNEFVGNLINTIDAFANKASEAFHVSKEAMNRVGRGSEELVETQRYVHDISSSTRNISESVNVIKDIADQVNLLSLNASIEAARAGEHGRGFSVVAEEISKLADTTQSNAGSITKTINEIIVNVEKELKAMETLTRAFEEIKQFIEETSRFMNEISLDVQSQKEMSSEVKKLFGDLMLMSQDNLTGAQEQSLAHQEIIRNVGNVGNLMILFSEKASGVRDLSKDLSSRAAGLRENIKIFTIE